ncbi:MAG TPA: ATP-binding protein [Acidimicrobiales bacterium]|nr:ATP-binding protein [Acidimicrobiales bacterium]
MPPERLRLRIGNLAKAVLVSGQAYQDPKDALNEFVSNAADEYVEAGRRGERIRVMLRRKGRYPVIAIDDVGRGMSPERLREIARNLFESAKAGDDRTLGEKAIGVLAFQQLGNRCDIVSRAEGSDETWVLRLQRGKATAQLERERRKTRQVPGTTVVLSDLEPDVLRVLTQRKVVDYLRARRGPALARGDYSIEVVEGRSVEVITPEKPEGLKLEIPARPTLWGRIEFALYVSPPDPRRRRRVAVVGRAGTTIVDDIAEIEEFAQPPWDSGQVAGEVVFVALQQTAGRRAVLRDREAFPVFVDAVKAVEAAVQRATEKLAHEVDAHAADRLAETLRRVFGRVLKELADLDNPMRTAVGDEPGTGGLFEAQAEAGTGPSKNGSGSPTAPAGVPELPELEGEPADTPTGPQPQARPDRRRTTDLPSVSPDPDPGQARSRFEAETGVVFYNDRHEDYLVVRDDEPGLLDYLATLVAKEYVLYNNPRAVNDDLAEEMVRMLVRVRRHLPRRR